MERAGKYKMFWEGPMVPYVRTTQKQKWCDERWKKYAAFKAEFRLVADVQNFPSDLDASLDYSILIHIWFTGSRRADVDNLGKSLLDSAFQQDKRIAEMHVVAHEYAGVDRVEVELSERGKRGSSTSRTRAV